MTSHEFLTVFQRMTSVYGNKAYPDERLDQFFETFKRMDADLFEKAVKRVVAESMTPPSLSKFSEYAMDYTREQQRRSSARLDEKIKDAPFCPLCAKTGSVLAETEKNGKTYTSAFLCICPVGGLLSEFSRTPRWNAVLYPKYRAKVRGTPESLKSEAELMALGFPASMIAAGRIIYKLVSGQTLTPKGLKTVKKLYGCTDDDFLDLIHEITEKKPGKWCKRFKERQGAAVEALKGMT